MSVKGAAKKTVNEVARDVLFAMLDAFEEVLQHVDRPLTDPELYTLMSAFKEARPYLHRDLVVDFGARVLRLVDMKAVRTEKGEYPETFDSFIGILVS